MSTDADDVLEFLDSLPAAKGKEKATSGNHDEDIMEFLDELENSNLDIKRKPSNNAAVASEKKVKTKKTTSRSEKKAPKESAKSDLKEAEGETALAKEAEEKVHEPSETKKEGQEKEEAKKHTETEEVLSDPISSISNWWSSSGSATVSNLWSKTTEQANQLKEKIATQEGNLHINDLGAKLTSIQGSSVISGLTSQLTKMVIGETEEVIRIHLVHDLHNLDEESIRYQIEDQFEKLLAQQVQGGIRIFADEWDHGKSDDNKVNLNIFEGKPIDGEKLCLANLENAIKTWENAKKDASRSNNSASKISDLFVSILACEITGKNDDTSLIIDAARQGNFHFIVILKDISNDILLIVRSQGYPSKWAKWLESGSLSNDSFNENIDPSDWVRPWVSEGLDLTFGIIAQQYVINRMNL